MDLQNYSIGYNEYGGQVSIELTNLVQTKGGTIKTFNLSPTLHGVGVNSIKYLAELNQKVTITNQTNQKEEIYKP